MPEERNYFSQHVREFAQHLLRMTEKYPNATLSFSGRNRESLYIGGNYPTVSYHTNDGGEIDGEPVITIHLC